MQFNMSLSSSRSPSSSPVPASPVSPGFNSSGHFPTIAVTSSGGHGSVTVCPGGMETVLFESYLHKTPPLRSIIMKWTKRWFVLSRSDPSDPSSIELSYYRDASKREKRQTINLSQFVGIRPNAKVGANEHVFAIETEERKYILKAPDQNTKNVWLAKLCELCGQEQVYHVTIPQQPAATYTEAILKFSSPANVTAVLPSNGKTILEIPFGTVRRMGCLQMYNIDVVWFETCKHSIPDNFLFFTVPSGTEAAQKIVRELKAAIEIYTSVLLIMEDCGDAELAFISREHYGCQEFSSTLRNRILSSGLNQVTPIWTNVSNDRLRESNRSGSCDAGMGGVSLEDWALHKNRRKMSISSMKSQPLPLRKPTLDKFRQASVTSFEHLSPSSELADGHFSDSGFTSDVFDPPLTPPRLSQQNSVSSHHSSHSSLAYSPAIMEGGSPFNYEENERATNFTASSRSSPLAPIVPPRSIISLRQDSYVETLA